MRIRGPAVTWLEATVDAKPRMAIVCPAAVDPETRCVLVSCPVATRRAPTGSEPVRRACFGGGGNSS